MLVFRSSRSVLMSKSSKSMILFCRGMEGHTSNKQIMGIQASQAKPTGVAMLMFRQIQLVFRTYHNNNINTCQPWLGACGASLSSPGRLVLSDLVEACFHYLVFNRDLQSFTGQPSVKDATDKNQTQGAQAAESGTLQTLLCGRVHVPTRAICQLCTIPQTLKDRGHVSM